MRWLANTVTLLVISGCAFDAGQPWGVLEARVEARFAPPADRLLPGGGFRTAADYGVELETLAVEMVDLRVQYAAATGLSFDPAKPPPGYTLCHGGHCHSVDGRLVDYADVAAEQSGGGALSVDLPVDRTVTLAAQPVRVTPAGCPNDCALERGEQAFLRLRLQALTLTGRVKDLLPGSPRLPPEGVTIQGRIPLDLALTRELQATVGRGESLGVRLTGELNLAATLLDGVQWQELPRVGQAIDLSSALPAEVLADLFERTRLGTTWDVVVQRF